MKMCPICGGDATPSLRIGRLDTLRPGTILTVTGVPELSAQFHNCSDLQLWVFRAAKGLVSDAIDRTGWRQVLVGKINGPIEILNAHTYVIHNALIENRVPFFTIDPLQFINLRDWLVDLIQEAWPPLGSWPDKPGSRGSYEYTRQLQHIANDLIPVWAEQNQDPVTQWWRKRLAEPIPEELIAECEF